MVVWQPIGITIGVYDMCNRYLLEKKQFGAPLAAFQINQQKLVQMLANIQAMFLKGWRLCKLYEAGKMTPGQAILGKSWITLRATETIALGRELLGGDGILSDFLVVKIREGRFQPLDQCLAREYSTSLCFLSNQVSGDLCEWDTPSLEAVTKDMVDCYFAPLPDSEPQLNLPTAFVTNRYSCRWSVAKYPIGINFCCLIARDKRNFYV